MPSGTSLYAAQAISLKVFTWSGTPFTLKRSTSHSRSPSATSSRWAAIFFALAWILRAARRGGARAVGAEPVGRGVGVAFLDLDVVGGNAGLGGDDLGVSGGVPLALAHGAH